jgi:anti-anti-sigma factor
MPAPQEYVFEHLCIRPLSEGDVDVFMLEGCLDAGNLPEFEATIMKSCNLPGAHVLVDCEGLTHLSSSGIGSFYRLFNACRSNGGAFSICAVPGRIGAVLDLVGLSRVLKPASNRSSAVAQLSAPGATS